MTTRPEVSTEPDHGVLGVGVGLVALLGRGEQEQRVVHGHAEDHGPEEQRPPGVDEALRGEVEQPGEMPVLEDEPGDSEGPGDRQGGDEDPGGGEQRRAEGDEQQEEADHGQQPEHQRGVRGEGVLEVVVLRGRAADQAAGGQDLADPVDGGPGGRRRRAGGGHDLVEGPAGVGRPGDHRGDTGGVGEGGERGALVTGGDEDLQGARGARARRPW